MKNIIAQHGNTTGMTVAQARKYFGSFSTNPAKNNEYSTTNPVSSRDPLVLKLSKDPRYTRVPLNYVLKPGEYITSLGNDYQFVFRPGESSENINNSAPIYSKPNSIISEKPIKFDFSKPIGKPIISSTPSIPSTNDFTPEKRPSTNMSQEEFLDPNTVDHTINNPYSIDGKWNPADWQKYQATIRKRKEDAKRINDPFAGKIKQYGGGNLQPIIPEKLKSNLQNANELRLLTNNLPNYHEFDGKMYENLINNILDNPDKYKKENEYLNNWIKEKTGMEVIKAPIKKLIFK